MDILKKLGFGTMRLPVDENEDINYELIGQMVDIFVRNGDCEKKSVNKILL